jgi:hypothetical protein
VVHRVVLEAAVASSNAAHADSTTKPADMANASNAADMGATAKASHMAAAESTAAARFGRACQQTRSQQGGCQDRYHSSHHKTPFNGEQFGAVRWRPIGPRRPNDVMGERWGRRALRSIKFGFREQHHVTRRGSRKTSWQDILPTRFFT